MEILHNGKSYGHWEMEALPRLAEKLEVSLDDLLISSNQAAAKGKAARKIKQAVETRLGPQEKINAVTANAASFALIGLVAVLDAIKATDGMEAVRARVDQNLSDIFKDVEDGATTARFMEMFENYQSGALKTPIHAVGVKKAMDAAEFCANEAFNILAENVPEPDQNPPETEQVDLGDENPVTG